MLEPVLVPRWVIAYCTALISFGAGVIVVAALLFAGYVLDRYSHANPVTAQQRVYEEGLAWCLGGTFGNACWELEP